MKQVTFKSLFLVLLLMLMIVAMCACSTPDAPPDGGVDEEATGDEQAGTTETITIAMYAPTQGDVSRYGEVLGNSLKLACTLANEAGGVVCGDITYYFDYKLYDNGFYEPSAQARSCLEAIVNDGLNFSFGTYTSDVVKACADYVTDNEHLYVSWGMGYLDAKYPYIISALSGPQAGIVGLLTYLMEENDITEVAILQQDSALGATLQEWDKIAVTMNGGNIAYSSVYAGSTTDYTALFQSIVSSGAQIIEIGSVSGATQALMLEAARSVGYTGFFTAHEWVLGDIEERDPSLLEYMDGKAYFPTMDYTATGAPALCMDFYAGYVDMFGEAAWESFAMYPYENFLLLKYGIELAASSDSTAVRDALLDADVINHPLYGDSTWWGNDMYGWDCCLMTPAAVSTVSNGELAFVEMYSLTDCMANFSEYYGK